MSTAKTTNIFSPLTRWSGWFGLAVAASLAAAATWMAQWPAIAKSGLSPLTLAIVLGILVGNTVFPLYAELCGDGVDFSKTILLRAGIILYGFRITFQQVLEVGWRGLVADCVVISSIFGLAVVIGRWLRIERDTAILIGAGSGICGAAAVMATEPVVKATPAKVSVAVATVVLFGTTSMFLYPLLKGPFGLSDGAYGLFVGSTVHEVAQVVAAGRAVGERAASVAVIVKMLRVMMLAPFLIVVSMLWNRSPDAAQDPSHQKGPQAAAPRAGGRLQHIDVPWFAVAFLLVTCVYSTGLVPPAAVSWLVSIDTAFLAMAMSALGLRTRFTALYAAGPRPMLLAAILFVALLSEGFLLARILGT